MYSIGETPREIIQTYFILYFAHLDIHWVVNDYLVFCIACILSVRIYILFIKLRCNAAINNLYVWSCSIPYLICAINVCVFFIDANRAKLFSFYIFRHDHNLQISVGYGRVQQTKNWCITVDITQLFHGLCHLSENIQNSNIHKSIWYTFREQC